jgi:site-specific recombinase XerD
MDVPFTKPAAKLPKVLSKEQVMRMLEVTANLKHRLTLALLYYAGLRLSEVIALRWEDIDFDRGLIHLHKNEKERIVFLHNRLRELLSVFGAGAGLILISERGKGYNKRTVQQIVKQAARKAKIKKQVTPHVLRHSFATHLLEGGADIRYIQQLLGHKNLQTTQIYTYVANRDIKRLANLL